LSLGQCLAVKLPRRRVLGIECHGTGEMLCRELCVAELEIFVPERENATTRCPSRPPASSGSWRVPPIRSPWLLLDALACLAIDAMHRIDHLLRSAGDLSLRRWRRASRRCCAGTRFVAGTAAPSW
jgi:hypothetical protein